MSLYPLVLSFESTLGDLKITVTQERWLLVDRALFDRLPASERLRLRSKFEAQVALAKATPV